MNTYSDDNIGTARPAAEASPYERAAHREARQAARAASASRAHAAHGSHAAATSSAPRWRLAAIAASVLALAIAAILVVPPLLQPPAANQQGIPAESSYQAAAEGSAGQQPDGEGGAVQAATDPGTTSQDQMPQDQAAQDQGDQAATASNPAASDQPAPTQGESPENASALPSLTEAAMEEPSPEDSLPTDWNLILVNASHPIPDGYTAGELIELRNEQAVDKRIYPELQQMFDDCRAAGLDPYINSSFRSHETQVSIMEERVESYMWDGYSAEEARAMAESEVAIPGTSEHELGLALDIMSERESYDGNAEVRDWLAANGYRYGFILRYPEDKTHITGIVGEPWHFRYVGVEAATAMHESGQCFEEYLGIA